MSTVDPQLIDPSDNVLSMTAGRTARQAFEEQPS